MWCLRQLTSRTWFALAAAWGSSRSKRQAPRTSTPTRNTRTGPQASWRKRVASNAAGRSDRLRHTGMGKSRTSGRSRQNCATRTERVRDLGKGERKVEWSEGVRASARKRTEEHTVLRSTYLPASHARLTRVARTHKRARSRTFVRSLTPGNRWLPSANGQ